MRDRPRLQAWWAAAALALALESGRVLAAEHTFNGELIGRYNNFESFVLTPRSDGSFALTRQTTAYWTQEYRAGFGAELRPRTNLFAELRYSDVSFVNGAQHTTIPSGLVRITAPIYGLTASYRPIRRTNQVTTLETGSDSIGRFQRTEHLSRNSDLLLSAYVAAARLPRIEGQWVERHQYATPTTPAGSGSQRSLRAAQDFGHLSLVAGYADQLSRSNGSQRTLRRTWNGGANFGAMIAGHNPLSLAYDYLRSESPGRNGGSRSNSHNLNASAGYRFSQRASLDGGGFYRLADLHDGHRTTVQDYDVYGYHRYAFSSFVSSRLGGGQRSFRDSTGVHGSPYLLAALSAEGTPRPRWRARGGIAHSTNWLTNRIPSSSSTFNLGSTFEVARTCDFHFDLQSGTRLGSLRATAGRYASTASGGVRLQPLRSTTFLIDASVQANGSSLIAPSSRSTSESASLQWRPTRNFHLLIQRGSTGAFPNNRPRQVSTTFTAGWQPGKALQIEGNYAKSGGLGVSSSLGTEGSETYGLRIAGRLSRRLTTSFGLQQANRGKPSESRYFDAMASYRFDL